MNYYTDRNTRAKWWNMYDTYLDLSHNSSSSDSLFEMIARLESQLSNLATKSDLRECHTTISSSEIDAITGVRIT